MGGGPPQPPQNFGNMPPPSHGQHYGNMPPQHQPPPHGYGNGIHFVLPFQASICNGKNLLFQFKTLILVMDLVFLNHPICTKHHHRHSSHLQFNIKQLNQPMKMCGLKPRLEMENHTTTMQKQEKPLGQSLKGKT